MRKIIFILLVIFNFSNVIALEEDASFLCLKTKFVKLGFVIDDSSSVTHGLIFGLASWTPGINGINVSFFNNDNQSNGIKIGMLSGSKVHNGIGVGGIFGGYEVLNGVLLGGGTFIHKKLNGAIFSLIFSRENGAKNFLNSDHTVNGISVCGISMGAGNINGVTVTGVACAVNNFNGIAMTVILNKIKNIKGITFSIIKNDIDKQNGVSIGLFNKAKNLKGLQLGLINYAGNNPKWLRWVPFFNYSP